MSVELLFYVPIIHHDALLLGLGQIRNNAHFSFLVPTYVKVEHWRRIVMTSGIGVYLPVLIKTGHTVHSPIDAHLLKL